MSILVIFGIAFGLAMDAFAASVACGVILCGASWKQIARLSFYFGFFQFMMPIIGWLAGLTIRQWIDSYDHWVAFWLLGFIGLKMIRESFIKHEDREYTTDPTRGLTALTLAIATSLDALAIGLVFATKAMSVWYPSVIIGLVAAGMTALGMSIGCRIGPRLGQKMELLGGLVLLGIGLKILAEGLI